MDRLFHNLTHVMSANVVSGLVNFLSTIWFARALGPELIGEYAIILVAIQLMTAFLSPGLNQALIRNPTNMGLAAAATLGTLVQSLLIIAASSAIYGLAVMVSAKDVEGLFIPALGMLASTILSLWAYLFSVPFEAGLDYRRLVHIRIIALAVSMVTGVLAVKGGYGVNALIVRDVVSSSVSLVLIRFRSPMSLTCRGWRAGMPELVQFVRGLWPLNILERLVVRLDYAVVGSLFDIETLGIYFAIRGIVEGALGFLLSPIQTVLYAYYCRLRSIHVVVETLLRRDRLTLMALLTLGTMVVLQAGGEPIIAAVLGSRYQGGYTLLGGLMLYAISAAWFEHMKILAMSQGHHHPMTIARLTQLILSVVSIYPFVRALGLTGAGLSAGVAAAAMAILSTWIFTRTFRPFPSQSGFQRDPASVKGFTKNIWHTS